MLRKTNIFKKIFDYVFKILCNTLNIFKITMSQKEKMTCVKYTCHSLSVKMIFCYLISSAVGP